MVPSDVTAVAGVSRSGLSSAMQLSELLHLHPFAVSMNGILTPLAHGFRFRQARKDDGRLLIVDDTVASGASLRQLQKVIYRTKRDCLFAVTFANPQQAHLVSFFGEPLELPHYLEWNFFNSVHVPQAAFDFDGILCHDCAREDDDDGERYLRFLAEVLPLYPVRRTPIPLVVTARSDKYRPHTEAWLRKWRIVVDRLVMGPWQTVADRAGKDVAQYKALHYGASRCTLFVESCPSQARRIADLSGKRVICPTSAEVHN